MAGPNQSVSQTHHILYSILDIDIALSYIVYKSTKYRDKQNFSYFLPPQLDFVDKNLIAEILVQPDLDMRQYFLDWCDHQEQYCSLCAKTSNTMAIRRHTCPTMRFDAYLRLAEQLSMTKIPLPMIFALGRVLADVPIDDMVAIRLFQNGKRLNIFNAPDTYGDLIGTTPDPATLVYSQKDTDGYTFIVSENCKALDIPVSIADCFVSPIQPSSSSSYAVVVKAKKVKSKKVKVLSSDEPLAYTTLKPKVHSVDRVLKSNAERKDSTRAPYHGAHAIDYCLERSDFVPEYTYLSSDKISAGPSGWMSYVNSKTRPRPRLKITCCDGEHGLDKAIG